MVGLHQINPNDINRVKLKLVSLGSVGGVGVGLLFGGFWILGCCLILLSIFLIVSNIEDLLY